MFFFSSACCSNDLKTAGNYYVWPVRNGNPIPPPNLSNNGDGTVSDSVTGLMWTRNADLPSGVRTWQQALNYIAGMNSGVYSNYGYTDWRLPEVGELHSLIEYGRVNPALPSGHPFLNIYYNSFWWTNTGAAEKTDYAWHVYVHSGNVANAHKNTTYYVWPVRGGH